MWPGLDRKTLPAGGRGLVLAALCAGLLAACEEESVMSAAGAEVKWAARRTSSLGTGHRRPTGGIVPLPARGHNQLVTRQNNLRRGLAAPGLKRG